MNFYISIKLHVFIFNPYYCNVERIFRPVFKPYTVELDTYSDFVIYKQEGNKLSEEDLIKQLQDLKRCVRYLYFLVCTLWIVENKTTRIFKIFRQCRSNAKSYCLYNKNALGPFKRSVCVCVSNDILRCRPSVGVESSFEKNANQIGKASCE